MDASSERARATVSSSSTSRERKRRGTSISFAERTRRATSELMRDNAKAKRDGLTRRALLRSQTLSSRLASSSRNTNDNDSHASDEPFESSEETSQGNASVEAVSPPPGRGESSGKGGRGREESSSPILCFLHCSNPPEGGFYDGPNGLHPDGVINLSTAENNLMGEEMLEVGGCQARGVFLC